MTGARSGAATSAPDIGEHPLDVEAQVRQAAMQKFGQAVYFNHWQSRTASNGYVTVRMHA